MVGSPAVRTRATCLAQLSIAAARVRIYSPLKGSVRVSMLEQYKKILVTGGCGFIGSHLVDALLSLGKAVTVIDNLSSGSEKNLIPEVRLMRGDVRDSGQVSEAMKGAELVFHVAANANGTRSINDPGFDFETNAAGTFNVLQAAVGGSVKNVVYLSSVSVYGTPRHFPMEMTTQQSPLSLTVRPSSLATSFAKPSSAHTDCQWLSGDCYAFTVPGEIRT